MTEAKIKEHYVKIAKKYGLSKQSTTEDANIRKLEVQILIECLKIVQCSKILEVGCGNGYTAQQIAKLGYRLTCIDFCEEFIKIAEKRSINSVYPVIFKVDNVLDLEFPDETFDLVFSERCLVNIMSWEKQKTALNEILRVLRPNGVYLMLEAFTDGLNKLNMARKAVGLKPILNRWFNHYFDKNQFLAFIKDKFIEYPGLPFNATSNFLSTYYFGTRVLYPALIANKMELIQNNEFDEFFSYLPPYGNYSPIQLLVLQKMF